MARPVDQQIKLEWPKVSIVNLSNAVFNSISLNMPGSSDFFSWGSFHVRLNSHYEAWSYKKKKHKRLHAGNLFRKNLQLKMSVNSRLKPTKIIGQRKAFYMLRIPESSCARKETVDIDILVTFRNGDRKIMQYIRVISRPPQEKGSETS